MKKALAASLLTALPILVASLPIYSRDCHGCGEHCHSVDLFDKMIVDTYSWHRECLEGREFSDRSQWLTFGGKQKPLIELGDVWFYTNPHNSLKRPHLND